MQLAKAVDNLCLYDPEFKFVADRFLRDLGGSSDICEVNNMEELRTALNSFRHVRFLELAVHGSPGTLHFGERFQMNASYIATLANTNPNLLQKNARILFDSCSVGKGNLGDQFMDRLGRELLRGKGGIIGASTVDNCASPLLPWTGVHMDPWDFSGRLKIKKYNPEGKLDGSMEVNRFGNRR